ncbi:hypothetical protein CBZ_08780 [Cellulomonas biazotea]|uniref:Lipoprotein n=1 Tax=Cellulomonas biazotea TaxID=1709 RepID=A0A402DNT4_9CELL|nr:hypothetical protein CBZ_08780 [Cellulomonas biazotea]
MPQSSVFRALRPAVVALVLAVTAAACAGAPGGGDEVPAGQEAEQAASSSPLDAYWSQIGTLGDADRQRHETLERLVARCMTEEGFTYEPVPYLPTSADALPGSGTLAWAREHGYGITTLAEAVSAAGGGTAGTDPNVATLNRMSDAERAAWTIAHRGAGAASTGGWQQQGCRGQAEHQLAAAALPGDDAGYLALREAYDAEPFDAASDPAVAQALAEWAGCVAAAGHPAATPDAAQDLVRDAQRAGTAKAELRALELAVAVADRTCQESTGYAAAVDAARAAHDQRFVDAHQAELDALVERWATTG